MEAQQQQGPSRKIGFTAGVAAGLLMTLVLSALRFVFDAEIVTEVMAEWLTSLMPISLFDFFLDTLQFNAKKLLFGMILVGQVATGGLFGIGYVRFNSDAGYSDGATGRAALLSLGIWLVLVLLVTPVMGEGFFGASLTDGPFTYSATLLFATGVYAVALTHLVPMFVGGATVQYSATRRDFLQKAAVFSAVAVVGGLAIQTIVSNLGRISPSFSGRRAGQLSTAVTPNEEFYTVAKSFVTPNVDVDEWKLELGNGVTLTYDDLLSMPSIEEYVTLTCISNLIGGDLIGNALWTGVPLRHVLDKAGIGPGTERVAFWAADGYVDSFPYDVAIRDEVIVAYKMNGVPLPVSHGFPARIIVPGLYGMENVKWLVKIESVEADFRGFWQRRGWADTAVIKTMSRIDMPAHGDAVPVDEVHVAGIAFAGDRGIRRVEVSVDDGESWRLAKFEPALSDYSWIIWELDWPDVMPDEVRLVVRATDGDGNLQESRITNNHPSGATGLHKVRVTITDAVPAASA